MTGPMPHGMQKRIKRIVAGAAAIAVVPAIGLATAGSAGAEELASGDTRDGHRVEISSTWQTYGWVTWNDYRNSDHSDDIDNFKVTDDGGDGYSIELKVYWKDKTYKAHAYHGESKTINIGNVPNNAKVAWEACGWNNGDRLTCIDGWFQE